MQRIEEEQEGPQKREEEEEWVKPSTTKV